MKTACLEKTLYYDGIAFLHYSLAYPCGEALPSFAEEMTQSYRSYLEGAYLMALCRAYDADPTPRKRIRHRTVQVVQTVTTFENEAYIAFRFRVCEDGAPIGFGVVWDKERGLLLTPRDFGVKGSAAKRTKTIFLKEQTLFLLDAAGKVWETRRLQE